MAVRLEKICLLLIICISIGVSQQAISYKVNTIDKTTKESKNEGFTSECNTNTNCITATVINNGKITRIDPIVSCNSTHNTANWALLNYFVQQERGNSTAFKKTIGTLLKLADNCLKVEEMEFMVDNVYRYKVVFPECKEQKKHDLTQEYIYQQSQTLIGKEGIIAVTENETQFSLPILSRDIVKEVREVSIISFALSYISKLFHL